MVNASLMAFSAFLRSSAVDVSSALNAAFTRSVTDANNLLLVEVVIVVLLSSSSFSSCFVFGIGSGTLFFLFFFVVVVVVFLPFQIIFFERSVQYGQSIRPGAERQCRRDGFHVQIVPSTDDSEAQSDAKSVG